jgi:hypothetical protein
MSAEPVVFSYGSTDHQSETNGYVLELTVKEESFSIEKNTSQVSYTLKLISGGSNRFLLHYTGAAVWLNGIQVGYRDRWTSPQVSLEYNSSVVLLSDTVTVHHSADGSCTMPVVFSIDIESNAYTPGPQTASGQMSLSVIPRKSSIGATDADIGEVSAVVVTKQSDSFTHSIAYSFGNLSGYITADGGVSDTERIFSRGAISFALPDSFYSQIPDAQTGVCSLTVNTYSGTTPVGSDSCSFTATANRYAVHPLATADMTDINEATVALTGDNKKMIRYCSTARCEMWVTTRGNARQTHAAIGDMYRPLEILSQGYTVLDMPAIEADGVYFYTVDSRGYDFGVWVQPTMIPYIKLTNRVDPKWTNISAGAAKLQFSGAYYAGSFGAAENTLHIQYKPLGQQDYIPVENITVEDGRYVAEVPLTGLDYREEYSFQVKVWDALTEIEHTVTLRKGKPVFHWGAEDFQFCVPVGMQDKSLRQVHSVNALSCGGVAFADNTAAYLPIQDRTLMLFGLAGNGGEYALYLVMLDSPDILNQCVRLSGTLDVEFTLESGGMLKIQSPHLRAYGWYIKNSDHADLVAQ